MSGAAEARPRGHPSHGVLESHRSATAPWPFMLIQGGKLKPKHTETTCTTVSSTWSSWAGFDTLLGLGCWCGWAIWNSLASWPSSTCRRNHSIGNWEPPPECAKKCAYNFASVPGDPIIGLRSKCPRHTCWRATQASHLDLKLPQNCATKKFRKLSLDSVFPFLVW